MNDTLIDIVEDIAEEGYHIGKFACKFFYQVSNLEALKNSMDNYMLSRFSQRLKYFVYEHSKISDKVKQEFYKDLTTNSRNLNYLYEFIENTRTTTYELQAKFLARLSVELIQNKTLQYQEVELIGIVSQLNDIDFISIKNNLVLPKNRMESGYFKIEETEDYYTYRKCIKLEIFDEMTKDNFRSNGLPLPSHDYNNNKFSKHAVHSHITNSFMKILDDIITT